MATTKVRGELVDFNPGNPDYILDSTNAVTVINAGGNQYNFNGVYGKFGAKIGTITLTGVPSSHPFALINNGKTSQISYTGSVNEGTAAGPDGNTYTFYSGTVTLTVSADFGTISYYCKIHGYMGGQDNLVYTYSDSGLKIPTGTNANRPATDVAGMIRNNTNETSDSSASCEEYYNGAAWKKINNVAFPPDFKTIAFTGNGGTQSITGVGFKPDFLWIKSTSGNTYSHVWTDSTRGVNSQVYVNDSSAATTYVSNVTSFDADGFSLGAATDSNASGANYLAFCWKVNGGTTSSNTDGSTTSTVQANQGLGFSIVKYTGTGSSASIGHGLSAAPEIIFLKKLTGSSDWLAGALDWTKYLEPNGTPPFRTANVWQDTAPTSSVFTVINSSNTNGEDYIAYCFHSASGESKFGTYVGTGSSNAITGLGFQPSWVLIKSTTTTEDWPIFSSSIADNYIVLNNGSTAQSFTFPFDSDGFTVPAASGMTNANGVTYLYLAFK